jgi:hypothetical protein
MLTHLFGRKDRSKTPDPRNEAPKSNPKFRGGPRPPGPEEFRGGLRPPGPENPLDEPSKHKSKKPTLKQEKFVEGVIQHGNATRAARDAGYSPRSAAVIASRNLQRPDIQEQIKARIEAAKLDTDEIIGTLIGHMRADIGNLLGDDGALDLVRAIENGSTHLIKKLTIRTRRIPGNKGSAPTERDGPSEETTYEIVLHDSQAAARHLARILHLEVKHRPIEARRPTDDELAHRMADLLERARARGRREGAANQRSTQTVESHSETAPAVTQNKQSTIPTDPALCVEKTAKIPSVPEATYLKAKEHELPKAFFASPMGVHEHPDRFQLPPGISNATEQFSGQNGLWNRVFSAARILTSINPLRMPFARDEDSRHHLHELFGQGRTPTPPLFGLLRS